MTIVRSGKGFKVKSKKGKNLSKGGLSRAQAEKRLKQIEFFKAMDKESKKRGR